MKTSHSDDSDTGEKSHWQIHSEATQHAAI